MIPQQRGGCRICWFFRTLRAHETREPQRTANHFFGKHGVAARRDCLESQGTSEAGISRLHYLLFGGNDSPPGSRSSALRRGDAVSNPTGVRRWREHPSGTPAVQSSAVRRAHFRAVGTAPIFFCLLTLGSGQPADAPGSSAAAPASHSHAAGLVSIFLGVCVFGVLSCVYRSIAGAGQHFAASASDTDI